MYERAKLRREVFTQCQPWIKRTIVDVLARDSKRRESLICLASQPIGQPLRQRRDLNAGNIREHHRIRPVCAIRRTLAGAALTLEYGNDGGRHRSCQQRLNGVNRGRSRANQSDSVTPQIAPRQSDLTNSVHCPVSSSPKVRHVRGREHRPFPPCGTGPRPTPTCTQPGSHEAAVRQLVARQSKAQGRRSGHCRVHEAYWVPIRPQSQSVSISQGSSAHRIGLRFRA